MRSGFSIKLVLGLVIGLMGLLMLVFEIKTLIGNSAKHVAQGVALVGETGETLARIVSQVGTIHRLIGEIARSAEEQATGLQEINTAVSEMDRMTQQNAAMVEQNTAATRSLASETAELEHAARGFRIEPPTRQVAMVA
jgi:methyl-accepting chemotaxis protein